MFQSRLTRANRRRAALDLVRKAAVHDPAPKRRTERERRHHRQRIGQARRFLRQIQLGIGTAGMEVMIRVARRVEHQQGRGPMGRVPGVFRPKGCIAARADLGAPQPIVLHIIAEDQLDLGQGAERQIGQNARRAKDHPDQNHRCAAAQTIAPKRVLQMPNPVRATRGATALQGPGCAQASEPTS